MGDDQARPWTAVFQRTFCPSPHLSGRAVVTGAVAGWFSEHCGHCASSGKAEAKTIASRARYRVTAVMLSEVWMLKAHSGWSSLRENPGKTSAHES